MKINRLFAIIGGGLFAAGVLSGWLLRGLPLESEFRKTASPITRKSIRKNAGHLSGEKLGKDAHAYKSNASHPFEKGQGSAWLFEKMRSEWKDWNGNSAVYFKILQTFLSLDADSSEEAFRAFLEVDTKWTGHEADEIKEFKINDNYRLLLTPIIARLSQMDPARALKLVETAGGGEVLILTAISNAVANSAVDIKAMLGSPDDKNHEMKLSAFIAGLAPDQPLRALALLEGHSGPSVEHQRQILVYNLAKSKPEEAAVLASGIMAGAGDSNVLWRALETWSETDKSKALEWASGYSGPGQADAKAFLLANKEITEDSSMAVEIYGNLQRKGANTEALSQAAAALVLKMAEDSPESARDWLVQLPSGAPKLKGLETLMPVWLNKDSYKASEWVETLPQGPERDVAAHHIINATIRTEPASAYQWAKTITNEEERTNQRREILNQWKQQDPDAAKEVELKDPP